MSFQGSRASDGDEHQDIYWGVVLGSTPVKGKQNWAEVKLQDLREASSILVGSSKSRMTMKSYPELG